MLVQVLRIFVIIMVDVKDIRLDCVNQLGLPEECDYELHRALEPYGVAFEEPVDFCDYFFNVERCAKLALKHSLDDACAIL